MGPLPLIALAFVAGIAAGLCWPAPLWALGPAAVGAAVAIGLAIRCGRLLAPAALAAALAIGWARAPEPEPAPTSNRGERACQRVYQGRVLAAPVRDGDRTRTTIDIEARSACLTAAARPALTRLAGTLFVTTMDRRRPDLERGDRIRLIATARPIRDRANPPRSAPSRPGTQWSAVVDRPDAAVRTGVAVGGPLAAFDSLRSDLADFWEQALGREQARLARALTLGEAAVLDPGQKERFRRTGTAHLLAVSGLHLGLVVLFAFAIARAALVRVTRLAARFDVTRLAALAAIPLAIAFALLTGARPPVVRACVMAVCALLGRALGRRAALGEAISLAAAGLLAWDPLELSRPGFQLSFAAVLGFVLVLGRRAPSGSYSAKPAGADPGRLARLASRVARAALRALEASVAAAAATSPLVLLHFERLSLVGIPVNAVAVPLAGFVIMPGLLVVTALAGPLPRLAEVLAQPAGAVLEALEACLTAVADLPCTLESPGPLAAIGVCLLCAAALIALARRRRPAILVAATALLALALSVPLDPPRLPTGRLTVDFLDVGQGDATLITFPGGAHWLVDAGGSTGGAYDMGEYLLVPILRALRVRRIDTLVLTHPDPDHVGGMAAVASRVEVGRIWDNGQGAAEGAVPQYGELLEIAARRSIPIERPAQICGAHTEGSVEIDVLHPCHDEVGYDPGLTFNDNSIVLHLAFGRVSLLLPGDLGREGEAIVLARGAIPRADLIKLGHHGSAASSSTAFLDAAGPSVAIASCGVWNRFGFPHASLLARLHRRGTHVLRTDRHGAIRVVTDGETMSITPRLPGPG